MDECPWCDREPIGDTTSGSHFPVYKCNECGEKWCDEDGPPCPECGESDYYHCDDVSA